jgi:malto-oligosyltrehalose synthase/4-alpha-glucanotransferase
MFNPVATYRLQFHKGFTFTDFEKIIPYLAKLGISTIYASPIFKAVPGSNHGYDVTDPLQINPEIGTLSQFRRVSKKLRQLNISWLQDIVPNHMAFHPDNAWLWDVLEKGRESRYAAFFDILWDAGDNLMVPFLGDTLDQVIANKELSITYRQKKFSFCYGGTNYPIRPESYRLIPKADLATLRKINGDSGLLKTIAAEQHYELCDWKESNVRMNYRRFFTVNGLICLNMQHTAVFSHYHQFIKSLADEGLIQGLRVDHIDGLFDPKGYLERLRGMMGEGCYIVVEKILEQGEHFPIDWPVQGNTGYDFLAQVNNLLTARESKETFTKCYQQLTGNRQSAAAAIPEKKSAILEQTMAGELENLYRLAVRFKLTAKPDRNLKAAIGELLVRCPVYRYYGNTMPLAPAEQKAISNLLAAVVNARPDLKEAAAQLKRILCYNGKNAGYGSRCVYFYQRCMQFSGPLMAKGVEDTLMYTYDRFIGHNEVGDSPELFGFETRQFHRQMTERQKNSPIGLNATSTHDTKRGEDVRARLNVLTDRAEEWIKLIPKWQKLNRELKKDGAPDANDEYLVYQTLSGFYPLPGQAPGDLEGRLKEYLVKALREAKVHTGWAHPDTGYESAACEFAIQLLDRSRPFWKSFSALQESIAYLAVINSLSQVLLKFTCPGIPDVYQGCESWDLSLVDPDNRRAVDYAALDKFLEQVKITPLWQDWYSGKLKTWLTAKLFHLRKEHAALFTTGAYLPLRVKGKYKNHIIAFARKELNQWAVVIGPLHLALIEEDLCKTGWENTAVVLPQNAPLEWTDRISQKPFLADEKIKVKDIFGVLPFGLLVSSAPGSARGAGIILPVSALPSPHPIGDMGPEARKFVDFLSGASQKYWQILPLNPTSACNQHSPYSSFSSMAGNTLLISPDILVNDGLLITTEVEKFRIISPHRVRYDQAEQQKNQLFQLAWQRFQKSASKEERAAFEHFKQTEAYWLDDFACYEVLKFAQRHTPWYEWPSPYKHRDEKTLALFTKTHQPEIDQSCWLQYIFLKQWNALKLYANQTGVRLIGDLPFYVSYDSVDVWTYPGLFKLDENRDMAGIAGVPPDYFNADGQLWGMPVYDWKALDKTGYAWWRGRISKNLQFFDLLRLDHFRAFYDYWEVPPVEPTAINGSWQPGPGTSLFKILKENLGELPFIAEDLGDISPGVYQLRDEFGLPGMNVLQYAFGADMPVSPHAPHNHKNRSITYSGTHDNNTAAGWFRKEASKLERKNLEFYARIKVTENNVHEVLAELCYRSSAALAMLPLQDVLGLGEDARINTPAAGEHNWQWRLKIKELTPKHQQLLIRLAKSYNR